MIVRDWHGNVHLLGPGEAYTVVCERAEHELQRATASGKFVLFRGTENECRAAANNLWTALQKSHSLLNLVTMYDSFQNKRPQLNIVPFPAEAREKTTEARKPRKKAATTKTKRAATRKRGK